MNLWLVAAAAAAGYFAKFWENLTTVRDGFPEVSSAYSGIGKDSIHKFAMIRKLQEDVPERRKFSDRKISDICGLNVASAAEVDSASVLDSEKFSDRHSWLLSDDIDFTMLSKKLLPWNVIRLLLVLF
ncbi:hypothetical protein HRI_001105400 [Hibiscus trionum]|uniref:Uncharacterized protein n=1 Tax=Hibiscus trionum TaxID=183268 RepID=A0A9W7LSK0_HIBTR|nr:hypothetical protein HRI_001105400 [Hibiscus trionum]